MAATRYYSVHEANRLLPGLRPLLERIRDRQAALAEDKALAVMRAKAAQNGGGRMGRQLVEQARELERDLKQIAELGIILRDPAIGLIDFYHRREGDTVFLCWRLGEARIEWWHPVSTGIAGRQRL